MPIDYKQYPENWQEIRATVLTRAGHQCEGSPRYPDCHAANYQPHPVTGSKVILTIAHVDQDITNNADGNLLAWCQRCHLMHDAKQHAENRKKRKLIA
jgi:hypothetical protein